MIDALENLIDHPCSSVYHALHGKSSNGHFRNLIFDQAEFRDGLSKLDPLFHIGYCILQCNLRRTYSPPTQSKANDIQGIEGHHMTLSNLSQDILKRHFGIGEDDTSRGRPFYPHLVLFLIY